ncbi:MULTISPECIES: hypothetical protein [Rhodococcus erythropolis group]|uniref:Uncharacterized protein n=2 Tax=Rhodococcus erythropolis group TaxID=2840174 RepID=A0AAW6LY00_RHOSG|nr:hypothetical protein [Rhodococcus qingshengii]MCT6735500.1 hypothetical protein [Rhodococcus qingshengii]MDE8649010.1 hypothetical protein [Rhodococcus qingshengii]
MSETVSDVHPEGFIPRSADGTYNLNTNYPKAEVRVRFVASNPTPISNKYSGTEYLRAANLSSNTLIPMLEDLGHFAVQIVDVVLVCQSCQFPIDGMTHPAC